MRVLTTVLLSLAAAGCGPELPMPGPGEQPGWAAHVEPLMLARCLACHTFEEAKAELVLEPGEGYQRMVGRPAVQAPDLLLVAPGEPERSYLWLKLDHRPVKGEGMPRTVAGAKRLPGRELDLVRAWIEAGAPP